MRGYKGSKGAVQWSFIGTRCLGGPKVFSRATRGAVQALRVAAAALFKLQWSLMVLGGPKVFSSAT